MSGIDRRHYLQRARDFCRIHGHSVREGASQCRRCGALRPTDVEGDQP